MNAPENKILNSVFQYGQSSTSFLTTYPGLKYFEYTNGEQIVLIAYVDTAFVWVGASDPIGPEDLWSASVQAFFKEAKKNRKSALLLPVSRKLALEARSLKLTTFQIGKEPWFQLVKFQEPKIAKQLQGKGAEVEVFEPTRLSAKERLELESITEDWLESRKSASLDFLNQVKPWLHMQYKRYFRVIYNGRQLGYLSAIPIPEMNAWYLIDLIRTPTAPLGTTELLISAAVSTLLKEGASFMTLGMAPLAKVEADERAIAPKLYGYFDFVFEKMSFFYNFKSLYQYKEKLKPTSWRPLYLITSERSFGIRSTLGLFQAIFPEGLLKTGFITASKIIKRMIRTPQLDRFLSRQIVIRSHPSSWLELFMRMKITLAIFITNLLFFIASTTDDFKLRPTAEKRFNFNINRFLTHGMDDEDVRALILHPFLHWNLLHIVFNLTLLLFLVGYLEVIAGSALIFITYILGIFFSNPLTSILIEPILRLIHPSLVDQFIHEVDLGCSLGVFAALGALIHFIQYPRVFVSILVSGTIVVSVMNSSILGLNHLIALAIGYGVGKYYVRKSEK